MLASIESSDLEYGGAWYRLSIRNGKRRDFIFITPEALDHAHGTDGVSWKGRSLSQDVIGKLLRLYEENGAGLASDAAPMELRLTVSEIRAVFGK